MSSICLYLHTGTSHSLSSGGTLLIIIFSWSLLSRWIKGVFGMALELNSSNSSQFSSQTPQLQNSMELPTPWNCSAYECGVLEHLFCCSRTTQYVTRFGVGGLLPTNATDYIKNKKGFISFSRLPRRLLSPARCWLLSCSALPPLLRRAAHPCRRCSGEDLISDLPDEL